MHEGWARYLTPRPVHRGLGLVCLGVGARGDSVFWYGERVLDCYAAVLITIRSNACAPAEHPVLAELRRMAIERYPSAELASRLGRSARELRAIVRGAPRT